MHGLSASYYACTANGIDFLDRTIFGWAGPILVAKVGPPRPNLGIYIWSVTPQLVPRHNWSPRTICGKLCCHRWSPGPSMAAMDGPLCRKWSPTSKPAQGG